MKWAEEPSFHLRQRVLVAFWVQPTLVSHTLGPGVPMRGRTHRDPGSVSRQRFSPQPTVFPPS